MNDSRKPIQIDDSTVDKEIALWQKNELREKETYIFNVVNVDDLVAGLDDDIILQLFDSNQKQIASN